MPRFLHKDDERLQDVICRWKIAAVEEVDDIGGWRRATDDPPDPMPAHVYERLVSGLGWDGPGNFSMDTTYLAGRITADYPKLDPTPLMDVCEAVEAWHADRNARRIPEQPILVSTLERAGLVLQAIEMDIQRRVVCEDGSHLVGRLLAASEMPKLFAEDLARLRVYLKKPMESSTRLHEPTERENRRKLQEIVDYNERLQSGGEGSPHRPGAEHPGSVGPPHGKRVSALIRSKLAKDQKPDLAAGMGEEPPHRSADDKPEPVAQSESGSVLLFRPQHPPIVKDKEKDRLTLAQYDVVLALLRAGDKGLTKDELESGSKRGDARKVLYRLADRDSDWDSVIPLPGSTGKRYRIV